MADKNTNGSSLPGQEKDLEAKSLNPNDPEQQDNHHQQQHHQHRHHQHHHRQHHKNGKHQERRRTILIAMDGSPHSFYAFDWYMQNLHSSPNDVIVAHSSGSANHVLSRSEQLMSSVLASDATVMSRLLEKEEEEINVIVQQIKGKLNSTGVRGKIVRLHGEPGPAIVESANQHQADCIVTGSRGLGTIRRTLIGSVSDYVLHHATCPVLVCRYHKDAKH